jgi:hypothetical protein
MTNNSTFISFDTEGASFLATKGAVPYDKQLIERLMEDHAELIDILNVLASVSAKTLDTVAVNLSSLQKLFQAHILAERVQFYSYLDRLLVDHPTVREEAHVVWLDMNEIASSIAQFIQDWTKKLPVEETLPLFLEHIGRTRQVLLARIELEENTLYTLYTETL